MKRKSLSKTLAVIAFILLLITPILSGSSENLELGLFSYSMIMLLGVSFIFAKNDVVKINGYGILALIAFEGLASLFGGISLENFGSIIELVITVLLLVSVINYFIHSVLAYYGYSMSPTEGTKTSLLKDWKKLVDNNKISEADYTLIKESILKNPHNAAINLQLKELKELFMNDLASSDDLEILRKK